MRTPALHLSQHHPGGFCRRSLAFGQGANLSLVSSLITRELTAEELGILNDMLREAET
jgi:hypothetical protein